MKLTSLSQGNTSFKEFARMDTTVIIHLYVNVLQFVFIQILFRPRFQTTSDLKSVVNYLLVINYFVML